MQKKIGKRIWIWHCFLLYGPFFLEQLYSLIIRNFKEPSAYWFYGVYFLLCYSVYGFVCTIHIKWRKSIGEPAVFAYAPGTVRRICIPMLIGIAGSKTAELIIYGQIFSPMIIRDIHAYFIGFSPKTIGAAGFILQYIYYGFEFTLITVLTDCAQKTSEKCGLTQKVPWGGIFLALTWGIGHAVTKNNIQGGLHSFFISLCIGIAYLLPGNKSVNAWCTAAAIFLF